MGTLRCYFEQGHFVVDDKCNQKLKTSSIENIIWAAESHESSLMRRGSEAREHLVYLNYFVAQPAFDRGGLVIKCPECGQRYSVNAIDFKNSKGKTPEEPYVKEFK